MHGSDSKQHSKGFENGARGWITYGYGLCPGSRLAIGWHTYGKKITVPSLLKMKQQNHSPQKAGQNLRPEPNQVKYLLKQTDKKINILLMIETRPRVS